MFFSVSLIIYFLLTATIAVLISNTGGLSSPFITLLMLVVVFSDIFGLWGALPILISVCGLTVYQYYNNNLTSGFIIIIAFSTLLPLITSFIIWHKKSQKNEPNDKNNKKNYHNIANELDEVANKSEVIINAIGDGVIAVNQQGLIQLINPAAQNILGWNKQDSLNLSYKSVLKLVDQKNEALADSIDPIWQSINTNQEMRTNNLALVTKSDKKLMISLVASPVSEINTGVIVVFRDITKEKAEEREQAEFISTASHEMRTPVASIEGYLGLALNPNTAQIDDRARDFIMKAHSSAEHLGHLFQDLLDISKAEDNRLSNNPKIINLVDFINEIVQGLNKKATDKGLRLVYKPRPENEGKHVLAPAYSVNLDSDHIREIVDNLIDNAIKYTPEGEIIINITGDDESVTISVKDNGIGIPAEDMPHLFQKFYRVENRDTRDIGGTGLGLYLSRRLAEILGGRIWAESTYKKGSTFYLKLPRANNQQIPQPKTNDLINTTPEQPIVNQITEAPIETKPAKSVPRGESLTAEQKAAYVSKQHELAQQSESETILDTPKPDSAPLVPITNNLSENTRTIKVPSRN